MAGYIGTKAVALSTTTGNILGDMTVGGTTDVATLEFNSLSGTGAVTITDILDEDNLASNSATKLATQQSIKAYVDAQVDTVDTLAEILAVGNRTSGAGKIEFRDAAIYLNSSADGQLDIVADTEIQIAATTVDINGAIALNGAVTGATNITLSGELDAATGDFSGIVDVAGVHTVSNTTDATATTDGALIVSGGVGIAKKLYVGTDITMQTGTAVFQNLDEAPLILISGTVGDKELIDFQRNGGAASGSLTYHQSPLGFSMGDDGGHTFRLKAGGTDRLTVQTTSGNSVVISDGLTLTDGNLIVAAGHGIDFSAQTATSASGASTTSELLDHYEEGSWTASVSSGTVSGTSSYTRIGRMVYVTADLTLAGTRGNEAFRIGGLPFAVPRWSPGGFYANSYSSEGTDQISGAASGGSSNVGFVAFGTEASGANFGNGYFVLSIWYNL